MITKTLIENFRETVKPFVSQILFGTNYEGMGTLDCVEFERDFDEILDLALAGYEQKVNNAVSTLDGNKNDMIYRQQAIDVIEDYPHGNMWNVESMEEMVDKIKALAPVQPERKKGEWVQIQRCSRDAQPDLECPFCKHRIGWFDMGRYCAGCGAKLKGGAG